MRTASLHLLFWALAFTVSCQNQIESDEAVKNAIIATTQPETLRPVEMGEHVRSLLEAQDYHEARIWYFRGFARSSVESELTDNYALTAFSQHAKSTPKFKHIIDIEIETLRAVVLAAIEWEANMPFEFADVLDQDQIARLPEIREKLSGYLAGFIAYEQEKRSTIGEIDLQILVDGFASEAMEIVPENNILGFQPISSAKINCEDNVRFVGQLNNVVSASSQGRLAAIYTCDELMIVDAVSGDILQRVSEDRFSITAVTLRASEDDIAVIALEEKISHNDLPGFFRMNASEPPHVFELPSPKRVAGSLDISIARSAKSRDGKILALEYCSKAYGCDFWFAAFDVDKQEIIWEAGDIGNGQSRLIAHIDREGDDYVLVSEVRSEDRKKIGLEYINLSDKTVRVDEYSRNDKEPEDYEMPSCELRRLQQDTGDVNSFGYSIIDPASDQAAQIRNPSRASIGSCTVSYDGNVFLVAVPPYIHRFSVARKQ